MAIDNEQNNEISQITLHIKYEKPISINGWTAEKDRITFDSSKELEKFICGEVAYDNMDNAIRKKDNEILLYAENETGNVIWKNEEEIVTNFISSEIDKKFADMTEDEKEALVQGVEMGMDYQLNIASEDIELYNRIIGERDRNILDNSLAQDIFDFYKSTELAFSSIDEVKNGFSTDLGLTFRKEIKEYVNEHYYELSNEMISLSTNIVNTLGKRITENVLSDFEKSKKSFQDNLQDICKIFIEIDVNVDGCVKEETQAILHNLGYMVGGFNQLINVNDSASISNLNMDSSNWTKFILPFEVKDDGNRITLYKQFNELYRDTNNNSYTIYWGYLNGSPSVLLKTPEGKLISSSDLTADYLEMKIELSDNLDNYKFGVVLQDTSKLMNLNAYIPLTTPAIQSFAIFKEYEQDDSDHSFKLFGLYSEENPVIRKASAMGLKQFTGTSKEQVEADFNLFCKNYNHNFKLVSMAELQKLSEDAISRIGNTDLVAYIGEWEEDNNIPANTRITENKSNTSIFEVKDNISADQVQQVYNSIRANSSRKR